jgi:hypothetical protein
MMMRASDRVTVLKSASVFAGKFHELHGGGTAAFEASDEGDPARLGVEEAALNGTSARGGHGMAGAMSSSGSATCSPDRSSVSLH